MFARKIGLFARVLRGAPQASVGKTRCLYTDSIYPYPFEYINNEVHPGEFCYRENNPVPKWIPQDHKEAKWMWRIFWTYFFISLFNDPGVIIGHHSFPDPEMWTDEELGIPPEDAGSYKDWLASKKSSESS